MENHWIKTEVRFGTKAAAAHTLRRCVEKLLSGKRKAELKSNVDGETPSSTRRQLLQELRNKQLGGEEAKSVARLNAIYDFIEHGWGVRIKRGVLEIQRPNREGLSATLYKEAVRSALQVERNKSLSEESVAKFIKQMETRQLTRAGWVSIFSLMRDGRELATSLRNRRDKRSIEELKRIVSPYLQFVESGKRCPETGLLLNDIWRYFRMTWSNKHESVPGRSMMILVRDRAVPGHPVIGIASLSSAVPHLPVRDKWIGWTSERVWTRINQERSAIWASWIHASWNLLLQELYIDDLIRDGVISVSDIRGPSVKAIERLEKEAATDRERHHNFVKRVDFQSSKGRGTNLREIAETPLYRSKRALALATLLRVKLVLIESGFTKPSVEGLGKLLNSPKARWLSDALVRARKARSMGIGIMEINVCGAIAPYSDVLGGKLVAMLLTSPEVAQSYRERYRDSDSVIASAMAGRTIRRDPVLTFLGTTSLYGISSSQYNRIVIPADRVVSGNSGEVRYRELGYSVGFGTFHISGETLKAMERVLAQARNGRRVNSIFGEGASPRLRKVRDGLDELGLPSDEILKHGDRRIVYGVNLVEDPGSYLLGLSDKPRYILGEDGKEATQRIIDWWMERWLLHRATREDVLERVERNEMTYPVRHGARVPTMQQETEVVLLHSVE